MTGTQRPRRYAPAALLPSGVLLGLLALLVLASAGPVAVIGPSTLRPHPPPPRRTASASAAASQPPDPLQGHRAQGDTGLSWVGELLSWLVLLGLLLVAVLVLRALWRRRPRLPEGRERLDVDPLPGVAAQAVARDAARQRSGLAEGDPRNGIVRCWMLVEEAVGEAGLPRKGAETSSEFTVRVLHALDLDPRTIGRLAALYREARFSEHPLGEGHRDEARTLLDRLHAELRVVTA